MPWLMALLRNSTLPGSTKSRRQRQQVRGRPASSRRPTARRRWPPRRGRRRGCRRSPCSMPMMPSEKLSTSISKPARTLPSTARSNCFSAQAGERAHDHRAEEHRRPLRVANSVMPPMITPTVAMAPTTAPRLPVDHLAAGVADQDGQEKVRAWGRPAWPGRRWAASRLDEHRRDQAPGDEGADVRHDHAGQVAAEFLNPGAEAGSFKVLVDACVRKSGHHLLPYSAGQRLDAQPGGGCPHRNLEGKTNRSQVNRRTLMLDRVVFGAWATKRARDARRGPSGRGTGQREAEPST